MKKIEDYLHLYLGCQVGIEDSVGVIHRYKSIGLKPKFDEQKKKQVTQVLIEPVQDINDPLYEPTCSSWEWPYKIKLLLRPLSDMSEEESLEWENINNQEYEKNKDLNGWSNGTLNDAESTRYLLSKHFDLFNLIPEGLAIDKKTLTT